MDRRTALEILDAVRPGSDDLREPEIAAAAEHLALDSAGEAIFLSRQHFDREIGEILRDVPVPSGLREKLLALQSDGTAVSGRAGDVSSDGRGIAEPVSVPPKEPAAQRISRRAWVRRIAVAGATIAAAALVGVGVFLSQGEKLTLAELQRQSPFDVASRAPFAGDFRPALPLEFSRAQSQGLMSFSRPGQLGADAATAVYEFQTPRRRRPREAIEGALLVVPAGRVADPPPHRTFQEAPSAGYFQSAHGGYTAVAWTAGDFVYVCYIKGGDDSLQQLRRALMIAPA